MVRHNNLTVEEAEQRIRDKLAGAKANGTGTGSSPQGVAADWEPIIPLGTLPPPPHFPLDSLPGPLADYVVQCAWATNSPQDFVGVPMLGMAAGCLGASRALAITRDHVQPATIFAAVVGLPGTGKSPALERVIDPLEAAERRFTKLWKDDLAAWKLEAPETRGDKPPPRRLLIDDTTTEALMKTMHANQRGLCMVCDELAGLVAGLNQYKDGKGHDRQIYLKIWAAASIRVDRKSNEDGLPLVVRRPSLSIVGGIQPDVVESLLVGKRGEKVNDGFLERYLFSWPRDLPAVEEQFREIEDAPLVAWHDSIQWLLSLEQGRDHDGIKRPTLVSMDASGRAAWIEFTRLHAAELNAENFPDHLRGPWSKLRGYCARLALVLHFLHQACSSALGPEDVDGDSVRRAAKLVAYFKAHYLRVAARMGADPRLDEATCVLAWLKRHQDIKTFSQRDGWRALHGSFKQADSLERALRLLEQYSYLRSLPDEPQTVGRKPSPRFEVSPLWGRIE